MSSSNLFKITARVSSWATYLHTKCFPKPIALGHDRPGRYPGQLGTFIHGERIENNFYKYNIIKLGWLKKHTHMWPVYSGWEPSFKMIILKDYNFLQTLSKLLAIPLWKLYSQLVHIPVHSQFLLAAARFDQIMLSPTLVTTFAFKWLQLFSSLSHPRGRFEAMENFS